MTLGPSSMELFLALLPCSRFISSICNGVTAALRLREALQPAIELINSLYYFTQINTPAVISTWCDWNWFQPICECNKCPFIKSIHSAGLLGPSGFGVPRGEGSGAKLAVGSLSPSRFCTDAPGSAAFPKKCSSSPTAGSSGLWNPKLDQSCVLAKFHLTYRQQHTSKNSPHKGSYIVQNNPNFLWTGAGWQSCSSIFVQHWNTDFNIIAAQNWEFYH